MWNLKKTTSLKYKQHSCPPPPSRSEKNDFCLQDSLTLSLYKEVKYLVPENVAKLGNSRWNSDCTYWWKWPKCEDDMWTCVWLTCRRETDHRSITMTIREGLLIIPEIAPHRIEFEVLDLFIAKLGARFTFQKCACPRSFNWLYGCDQWNPMFMVCSRSICIGSGFRADLDLVTKHQSHNQPINLLHPHLG